MSEIDDLSPRFTRVGGTRDSVLPPADNCGTTCSCAPGTQFSKLMRKSNDDLIRLMTRHRQLNKQASSIIDHAQLRSVMDEISDIEDKVFDLVESNWDRSIEE